MMRTSRALTGAWIETARVLPHHFGLLVAPSQARGLKQTNMSPTTLRISVAPSQARGLKLTMGVIDTLELGSRPHRRVD